MRILGTVSLLLLFTPVVLFAQGSGTQGTGTQSTSSSVSDNQVENQSAQGGFIGSGRPTGFVGVDEIYSTTSNSRSSRSSTARSNSRVTTTTRARTATSTAQRRLGTMTGTSLMMGGTSSTQSIRSITSLDAEMAVPTTRRPLPAVEPQLARIRGIQDYRLSFTSSPAGTTAVLKGTVASESERRVAQQLLLLEPGIHRVENLLEIR